MTDEPEDLADRERAALATLTAPAPPPDFAARVVAAAGATRESAHALAPATPRPRRGVAIAALAASVVLVGGGAALYTTSGDEGGGGSGEATTGAVTASARRTVAIGGRAVAVAEPGTALAWTVAAGGAVRVDQGTGNAFYRVDHGGPFVVATSLGEVRVTGTCFRVEVIMKPSKQSVVSGVVGAAVAAAVVVTVYEGGVVVAGRSGQATVKAGEHATLTDGGGAPVVGAGTAQQVAELAPPAAGATVDQLLARDELQRQRIAGLSTRVGELERIIAEGGGGGDPPYADGRPWHDPSPETLLEFAKNCEVRMDMPPIFDSTPVVLDERLGALFDLTAAERAAVNAALAELHKSWAERIRAVYLDVVGDAGADLTLSAQAMVQEIQDKSPDGEATAIKARIAQERAGLVAPPADWSHAPPIERLFRLLAGLGTETERLLADRVGADKAREMRAREGGWGNKWQMGGCDDTHGL